MTIIVFFSIISEFIRMMRLLISCEDVKYIVNCLVMDGEDFTNLLDENKTSWMNEEYLLDPIRHLKPLRKAIGLQDENKKNIMFMRMPKPRQKTIWLQDKNEKNITFMKCFD